jgi:lipoprotein-anchoring transpeptidase ErfK/SrfK
LTDVHAAGRALLGVDGVAALVHPHARLTPGYAAPDATKPPILAMEDTTLEQPATWLATAAEQDWIQVLVPLGRGGLPSDDPAAVNGCAVWVPSDGVDVAAARAVVVVSVSGRTAAITAPDGRTTTVSVGVGRENDTDTPRGLGSLVAFAATPAGLPVAVTSLQSTRLDGYDGASYAAFALHPDPEHGAAIGKARSNGCIRMDAGDFERLVDGVLPLGTPVWVVD